MVRRIRFTKSSLAQLRFGPKIVLVADSEMPGLKLKVHPLPKSGGRKPRKSFLLEKRIKGRKGSAVTFTLGTFPNMAVDQARQKAREYANLCEQGIDPRERERQRQIKSSKRRVTLREMVQKFWELHRKNLSPRTIQDYEDLFRLYFNPWMGRNLCELTADDLVEKYHQDLRRSKIAAKRGLKLLGQMWKMVAPLIRENGVRILPDSPIPEAKRTIGKWQLDTPKRVVIPVHKLGEFVAVLEQKCGNPKTPTGERTMFEAILTSLFCGLRHGECRKLRWQDIDLGLGLLTVVGEHAKNRQEHPVPLSDYMRLRLEALWQRRDPSCPYVFPSPCGKNGFRPISRNWLLIQRVVDELGIPFTPHAARRTFASIANYLGFPLLTLKRLINHLYQGGITGGYVVQGFDPLQNRKHFQAIADFIMEKRDAFLGVEKCGEQTKLEQLNAFAASVGLTPKEILKWAHSDGRRESDIQSQASTPN